jgi:hypothetical protein
MSLLGVKRERHAARVAAGCNTGLPLIAFAQIALPSSSTTNFTLTSPEILLAFAIAG